MTSSPFVYLCVIVTIFTLQICGQVLLEEYFDFSFQAPVSYTIPDPVCPGNTLLITSCPDEYKYASYAGDTMFTLLDLQSATLASNNDSCGSGSSILYTYKPGALSGSCDSLSLYFECVGSCMANVAIVLYTDFVSQDTFVYNGSAITGAYTIPQQICPGQTATISTSSYVNSLISSYGLSTLTLQRSNGSQLTVSTFLDGHGVTVQYTSTLPTCENLVMEGQCLFNTQSCSATVAVVLTNTTTVMRYNFGSANRKTYYYMPVQLCSGYTFQATTCYEIDSNARLVGDSVLTLATAADGVTVASDDNYCEAGSYISYETTTCTDLRLATECYNSSACAAISAISIMQILSRNYFSMSSVSSTYNVPNQLCSGQTLQVITCVSLTSISLSSVSLTIALSSGTEVAYKTFNSSGCITVTYAYDFSLTSTDCASFNVINQCSQCVGGETSLYLIATVTISQPNFTQVVKHSEGVVAYDYPTPVCTDKTLGVVTCSSVNPAAFSNGVASGTSIFSLNGDALTSNSSESICEDGGGQAYYTVDGDTCQYVQVLAFCSADYGLTYNSDCSGRAVLTYDVPSPSAAPSFQPTRQPVSTCRVTSYVEAESGAEFFRHTCIPPRYRIRA